MANLCFLVIIYCFTEENGFPNIEASLIGKIFLNSMALMKTAAFVMNRLNLNKEKGGFCCLGQK